MGLLFMSLLTWAYIRIKELQLPPGDLVLMQCLGEAAVALHLFINGVGDYELMSQDTKCKLEASMVTYVYFMFPTYNVFVAVETIYRVRNPFKIVAYWKRRIIYHFISQLIPILAVTFLIARNDYGISILGTCFIEGGSLAEVLMIIPIICQLAGFIGLCFIRRVNKLRTIKQKFLTNYLNRFMIFTVVYFSIWFIAAFSHVIDYWYQSHI